MAFNNCDSLETIRLPDSVTDLCAGVFSDCDNLHTVYVGSGIRNIHYSHFKNSAAISELHINNNAESVTIDEDLLSRTNLSKSKIFYN